MAPGSQLLTPRPTTPLVSPTGDSSGSGSGEGHGKPVWPAPRLTQGQQAPVDAVRLKHQFPAGSRGCHLLTASQVYKAQLPPHGGLPGVPWRYLWGRGTRARQGLGRGCPHQSHKANDLHHYLRHRPKSLSTSRGRPWLGGPGPAPSPRGDTHSLTADVEREQGMASAGGLVQGVSRAPSAAKT